MGTLKEDDIKKFMEFALKNGINLIHNCQLNDIDLFIKANGVTSRNKASSFGQITPFTSDSIDWERNNHLYVFGNFEDYGSRFHRNNEGYFPNCYGPISLEFSAYSLEVARDVSITLRSASANGFDRSKESLDYQDCIKLFNGKWVINRTKMAEAFPGRELKHPEFSLDVIDEILSFRYLSCIWVDPIEINGIKLLTLIQKKFEGTNVLIRQRFSSQYPLYRSLIKLAERGIKDIASPEAKAALSQYTAYDRILLLPRHVPNNFLSYLTIGTINQILEISLGESRLSAKK